MRWKRTLLFLGIAVVAWVVATLADYSGLSRRFRAQRVRETVLVSSGNRRLTSLYEGIPADRRWDAKAALNAAKNGPRCRGARGGGFIGSLLSLFESTASAQQLCLQTNCSGSFWAQGGDFVCNTQDCTGLYRTMVSNGSNNRYDGYYQPGTGCTGSGCGSACSWEHCNSATVGSACSGDAECGDPTLYCSTGKCALKQCTDPSGCSTTQFCCLPDSSGNSA